MELDAEPAQKPLAKIRQAKRFLRAGEEILKAAEAMEEEFWSDLDNGLDESYTDDHPRSPQGERPRGRHHLLPALAWLGDLHRTKSYSSRSSPRSAAP